MTTPNGGAFVAQLFQHPGAGGRHFAPVPDELAPPVTHAWGRTMLTRGVRLIESPHDESYGRAVVFEDLYGNRWDLVQPRHG